MPTSYPPDVRVDTAGKITKTISFDPITAPWKYPAYPVFPFQPPDTSEAYAASGPIPFPKKVPATRPEEV